MAKFILSGFADESSPMLDVQLDTLCELGIKHIEPRNVDGKNIAEFNHAEAEEMRKRLDARGISVSSIGSPIGKISIEDDMSEHLKHLNQVIDTARALGTQYIRMFSFFIPDGQYAKHRDEVFRRMDQMITLAHHTGIKLVHENEKAIYGDSTDRCVELMERFAPELGFVFDPSNFVQCEQDTKDGFPRLRKYTTYMHMKDSLYTHNMERANRDMGNVGVSDAHRPVGQGDGNVSWIIDQLAETGYEGFMSVEPHLTNCALVPGDGVAKFTAAAKALISLLEDKGQTWE